MSNEQEKTSGVYKRTTKNMSVFGGARSFLSNAREGGEVIGQGVRVLSNATRDSIKVGRFETFEQAMDRLGISDEQLPIIHNQLILQLYLTFFVGIAALASMANLIVQESYFASLVAGLIFLASITKTVQSSIQCEFIRERRLGITALWWSKPSAWLPSRIEGVIPMRPGDPLRDTKVVSNLAMASRKNFKFAAAIVVFGVVSYFVFFSFGWPLLSFGGALVFLFQGSNLSFEVYKRRQGYQCDLYPWLTAPNFWIPEVQAKKDRKSGDHSQTES